MNETLRISQLTEDELRGELTGCGVKVGPITDSTRKMWDQKLFMIKTGEINQEKNNEEVITNESADDVDSQVENGCNEVKAKVMVYFAVSIPQVLKAMTPAKRLVFTDRTAALSFMKKTPGARFKVFSCQEDAEAFSTIPTEELAGTIQIPKTEKPVNGDVVSFSSVKTQDLTKMRKLIERGAETEFRRLVWYNPRYLLSSGDTPVIVQEGLRYNALHSAALRNQPRMAQAILDTLNNPEFMEKLYPKDSMEARNKRIQHMVDLYLNMPDKGNLETPLHFACKFASVEMVKVLFSQPLLQREVLNKCGKTPYQVIGTRSRNPSDEINEEIQSLFTESVFIPLLRSEDNCVQPVIGKPWSPGVDSQSSLDLCKPLTPKDPKYKVRALAGPMSPSKAEHFWKMWNKTKKFSSKDFDTICSDDSKGLERVGRNLARDLSVPWSEYWDFLEGFSDLSTPDGLATLEQYLCEVELDVSADSDTDDMFDCSDVFDLHSSFSSEYVESAQLPDLNPTKHTVTSTPLKHQSRDNNINGDLENALDQTDFKTLIAESSKMEPELSTPPRRGSTETNHLSPIGELGELFSKLKIVSPIKSNEDSISETESIKPTNNSFRNVFGDISHLFTNTSKNTEYIESNSSTRINNWLSNNIFNEKSYSFEPERPKVCASNFLDKHNDNESITSDCTFATAPEYIDTNLSSSSSKSNIFINGETPTKDDVDILHVLKNCSITPDEYPCINKWKNNVLTQSEAKRKSWTSPKRFTESHSTPRRRLHNSPGVSNSSMDASNSALIVIRNNLLSSFMSL